MTFANIPEPRPLRELNFGVYLDRTVSHALPMQSVFFFHAPQLTNCLLTRWSRVSFPSVPNFLRDLLHPNMVNIAVNRGLVFHIYFLPFRPFSTISTLSYSLYSRVLIF